MIRRFRGDSGDNNSGGGEWLTTYADLMTLLLTFFVLLYAFSTLDAVKFKEISLSLSKALGGKTGVINSGGNVGQVPINQNPGNKLQNNQDPSLLNQQTKTEQMLRDVMNEIKANNLDAKVTVKEDARGIIIELQEHILFDPGRADLTVGSRETLSKIGTILKKYDTEIVIEGHTDNVPINSGYYQTNWELSSDRATKVLRYLVEYCGVNPRKIQATGCGEYRPIAPNDTPEGRQKNRRVNILIVTKENEVR